MRHKNVKFPRSRGDAGGSVNEGTERDQRLERVRFPHIAVVKDELGCGLRPRPRLVLWLPGRGRGR